MNRKPAVDLSEVVDFVAHFQHRVLQDALASAEAATWERRAEAFELARPRPGEFYGQATREDLAARDRRLAHLAAMCRYRASIASLESWGELAEELPPVTLLCPTCGTPTSPWTCSCGETRVGQEAS